MNLMEISLNSLNSFNEFDEFNVFNEFNEKLVSESWQPKIV